MKQKLRVELEDASKLSSIALSYRKLAPPDSPANRQTKYLYKYATTPVTILDVIKHLILYLSHRRNLFHSSFFTLLQIRVL